MAKYMAQGPHAYVMDVYCMYLLDPDERADWYGHNMPMSITGATLAHCKRQVRSKGWTFKRSGDAVCPKCQKQPPEIQDD